MASPAVLQEIGTRVAELLADTPSGILPLQHLAQIIQGSEGGTVQTNRERIRRAIEHCPDLGLMELTSRHRDWDVMLPDGDGAYLPVWIFHGYNWEINETVWRFVHSRAEVLTGAGSGRASWITTRATTDAAVAARKELLAQKREDGRRRIEQDTADRWAAAAEIDAEYVELLRRLEQAVPGIEVRVFGTSARSAGFFAGIEVPKTGGQAFKTLLRRIFPDNPADPADTNHTADDVPDPS